MEIRNTVTFSELKKMILNFQSKQMQLHVRGNPVTKLQFYDKFYKNYVTAS